MLKSKGFSQKIIFLFLTPSSINLICVEVVDAIKIAFNLLQIWVFKKKAKVSFDIAESLEFQF